MNGRKTVSCRAPYRWGSSKRRLAFEVGRERFHPSERVSGRSLRVSFFHTLHIISYHIIWNYVCTRRKIWRTPRYGAAQRGAESGGAPRRRIEGNRRCPPNRSVGLSDSRVNHIGSFPLVSSTLPANYRHS